jgi:hypothetical protein
VIDQFFVGSINEWLAFKKDIHPLFQEQESIKSFTSDADGQVVTEIYDKKVEIYCRAIFKNLSSKKDNVEIILEADYLKGNKSLKSESVRLTNESLD